MAKTNPKKTQVAAATKPQVIVVLSGGCVTSVYADQPTNVTVLDHDDLSVEEITPSKRNWLDQVEKRISKMLEVY